MAFFTAKYLNRLAALLVIATSLIASNTQAEDKKVNASFNYILDGKMVNGWGMQLGDPTNWGTPVADRTGHSAGEKLSVEPADYQGKGDAIKLTWDPKKDMRGIFAVYGAPIDLSAVENDVAIVYDMKIDVMPNKDAFIGMDCGYPCGGELHMKKTLSRFKKGEWFSLPIAINCFSKEKVDLKKVNGPIKISTDGKMTLEIANVRLQRLADGDKGCSK